MRKAKLVTGLLLGGLLVAWLPALAPGRAGAAARSSRTAVPAAGPARDLASAGVQLGFIGQVKLGKASAIADWPGAPITQAGDGSVYFVEGRTVYKVKGVTAPVAVLNAPGTVLAVAADSSDLYVEIGQRIDDYSLAHKTLSRSWTLPSIVKRVTQAGLLLGPGIIWAWSDWGTDESGFEYASIVEIPATGRTLRVVADNDADPVYMAADASGLYYEFVNTKATSQLTYLVHVRANGAKTTSKALDIETFSPLALGPGYVAVFGTGGAQNTPYVGTYSSTTLAKLASPKLSFTAADAVGTPEGLLAIDGNVVTFVNHLTGALGTGTLVPGAWKLLYANGVSAIASYQGTDYLVRRGSWPATSNEGIARSHFPEPRRTRLRDALL